MNEKERENRQRDIATLRVLGIFFSVMGGLVLIAIYETLGNTPAMIVNILSGVALAAVGIGMITISKRMSRRDE
jgi:small neutral amino acid transporter SnatA (MarC family)